MSVVGPDLGSDAQVVVTDSVGDAAGADPEPSPPEAVPGEKLAAQVARQIEASVIELGWPVGAVLGSEMELRERYGVSRSIVREAVRLTEHHQVTRMRPGPGGGLVVVAPDAGPAMRALVIYLEYVGLTLADLLEARLLLEPIAAAAAAKRVDEGDIAQLRALLDDEVARADEPGLHVQERLHVVLARMSGNPVLELFVDVLTRLTTNQAYSTRKLTKAEITQGKDSAHSRHEAIVAAVLAGDPGRASAETTDHLQEIAEWLRQREGRWKSARTVRQAPEPADHAKLAETVAAKVLGEITRRGWPIGFVLGSETDLLARHGVSRAVLREAVRILEYHSVARMRRGPGGGLVVTEPEADASIDAIALYLDYRKVGPAHLVTVREAIELGALPAVLARRAEPEVTESLRAAIARTGDPMPHGRTGADRFHAELAVLSGNPVLTLFLRILTELWSRHTANTPGPQPGPDAVATVEAVHNRILAAILDGDEDLARHRLRRHLEALKAWYH